MVLKEAAKEYLNKKPRSNVNYLMGEMFKIKAPQSRVVSITSGKGGVGKTNAVANLAYALCQTGKKVLIVDADLGLANVDILFGLTPKYNLQHVILGQKRLSEVIVSGPGGVKVLPASSGVEELTNLNADQRKRLMAEFSHLDEAYDFILIDTAAGISSNVIYFNLAAAEIINIVEPDPTSFTDAYALMKVLSVKYGVTDFKVVVNNVISEGEAKELFEKLKLVSSKFLQINLHYLGYVLHDEKLKEAVRMQKAVVDAFPYAKSSRCFYQIVKNLCRIPKEHIDKQGFNKFLTKLLGRGE